MPFPSTDLPAHAEILISGVWTDIVAARDLRSAQGITVRRGLTSESSSPEPSSCTLTLNNRTAAKYSPRVPTSANYRLIGRNTPLRVSVDQATSYLSIDHPTGTTTTPTYVSTPDNAALDITGNFDLRWDGDLTSWGSGMELIGKWAETGNQRSYRLSMVSGRLTLWWSTLGTAATAFGVRSAQLPISSGRLAVRAAFTTTSVTFYTSDTIAGTWTQLGDVTTFGASSVLSGTAALRILDNPDAVDLPQSIRGRVYAAQVRNSASTLVANPDFTAQTHGATSFADSAGRTWTLNGLCSISKRDWRFHGEIPAWPVRWDIGGDDVHVPIEAAGPMRRLGQGVAPLRSAMYRSINRGDPIAYWPLEDGAGAQLLALGIDSSTSPADPMYMVNAANLATNTEFPGSEPLPEFNNASLNGRIKNHSFSGEIQVRFVVKVASGSPDGAVIARVYTRGTAYRWDLIYKTTTGGSLQLSAFDIEGTLIGGSAVSAFELDNAPCRLSIELSTSGPSVDWAIRRIFVGAGSGNVLSGTLAGATIGSVSRITMNPNRNLTDTAVGHVSYENDLTSQYDLINELNGYVTETAGRRFERLCLEEGVESVIHGNIDDTVPMGIQRPLPLLDLLRECAFVDGGHLFEPREFFGLAFRTRESLHSQPVALSVPYATLSDLQPLDDDANAVNDVTVQRPEGSSARAVLGSGALSILPPPSGIGRYDTSVETNVADDTLLANQAGWRLHVGTVDEPRYPDITIYQHGPRVVNSAALLAQLLVADIGDELEVTGPPAWLPPETINQLIIGWTETLGQRMRTLALVCTPASPFAVPRYEPTGATASTARPTAGRYSSSGTTVVASKTTTATSWAVTTPSGPAWTTAAAQLPFDMMCEGERMTLTAVSGTTANQTFTFVRSVNGVVKTHGAGAVLDLFQPAYYG